MKDMKLIMESWRKFSKQSNLVNESSFDWRSALGKVKDFFMKDGDSGSIESALSKEEWREILNSSAEAGSDFPADGVEPIDPSSLDVHDGGADTLDIPSLNPPGPPQDTDTVKMSTFSNVNAPIKNRKAIEYDPQDWESDADARIAVDRGFQQKLKSDRDLFWSQKAALGIATKINDEVGEMETKLTELEGARTITPQEAEEHRERMEGWYAVLGNLDTIDENIFKVAREIEDMYEETPQLRDEDTVQDTEPFSRSQGTALNRAASDERKKAVTQVGYPRPNNQN